MIGAAIYALLTEDPATSALIGQRVHPVQFEQAAAFPVVYYGTGGIQRLNCRGAKNEYFGTLEIGVMTETYADLEAVVSAVKTRLDDFDGVVAGFSMYIEPGVDNPDEPVPELNALYKRIDFDVNVTKLV